MINESVGAPYVRMTLGGIEDFPTAAALLRATGARRPDEDPAGRTFVIDRPLTPQEVAALLWFVDHGREEGFLKVTANPGPIDEDGAEEWWHTA